ncbi:hypothetical protein K8P10_001827 [Leucobacter sp. Psy1]|uniref:diguanylate cyclase domain-containing protein n=1 Tax=Leucobacter sp. Psy1 TaxID=2875729 RepID=UPI002105FC1F|nr:diguanylate cyclase [Leucobacter sp. Psy1]UBH06316.1 hypothetical protein K8P10_001827 [Leucobacter sp. Psy1]
MFADVWKASIRSGDCVVRVGGDEFLVVLRNATATDIATIIERVAASSPIEFSVGTATVHAEGRFADAVERADLELYRHKTERRG